MFKMKQNIRVETYQFIDNLEHIISPREIYVDSQYEILINEVKQAFINAGWEGDGEIGLIWIPPFINHHSNDTMGEYIWHVKQKNNGISFLGHIENVVELEVAEKDLEQNDSNAETITKGYTEFLNEEIKRHKELLHDLKRAKGNGVLDSLYYVTLNALQNQVIAEFVDYIDEIYLQFAEHVLGQNNLDGLKLSKTKINLPLDTISDGIEEGYMDSWLILKNIISALWRDFKFWKFGDKFREICRCVDFDCPDNIKRMILKHIEIRNSIQHHGGEFTNDVAKAIGQQKMILLDENNREVRIELWKEIKLSICEVNELLCTLEKFVNMYENQIEKRMTTRLSRFIQI